MYGGHAIIYVDGACSRNGLPDASAAIGVDWPDRPSLNVSERIGGRQTNQRAEILAAARGIEQAKRQGYSSVEVRLDSAYVRRACEEWMPNWERTNWNNNQISNRADFERLRNAMRDIDVEFTQVPRDENPADALARYAARS